MHRLEPEKTLLKCARQLFFPSIKRVSLCPFFVAADQVAQVLVDVLVGSVLDHVRGHKLVQRTAITDRRGGRVGHRGIRLHIFMTTKNEHTTRKPLEPLCRATLYDVSLYLVVITLGEWCITTLSMVVLPTLLHKDARAAQRVPAQSGNKRAVQVS